MRYSDALLLIAINGIKKIGDHHCLRFSGIIQSLELTFSAND
jgi:hypothetical protein